MKRDNAARIVKPHAAPIVVSVLIKRGLDEARVTSIQAGKVT
jgi:hypothetical protein